MNVPHEGRAPAAEPEHTSKAQTERRLPMKNQTFGIEIETTGR